MGVDVHAHGSTSREQLLTVFSKYVDHQDDKGQKFISGNNFVRNFIGVKVDKDAKSDILSLLTRIADTTSDGLVSFEEFCAFEKFLSTPDAMYRMVFRLFDATSTGFVTFEEFKTVYSKTVAHEKVPFDFNSQFVSRYFGHDKKRELSYTDFTQFLHNLQYEHAKQAFEKRDKEKDGSIFPLDLQEIMTTLRPQVLTPFASETLIALAHGNKVSFPTFLAINNVLTNIERFEEIYEDVLKSRNAKNKETNVLKEDFVRAALQYSDVSPLEVDLLFEMVSFDHSAGHISREDFEKLIPRCMKPQNVDSIQSSNALAPSEPGRQRSNFLAVLESVYRFGLGSFAGSCGATAVYPIDLVKTRLQNQRSTLVGEVMYKNFWDCFGKVIKFEGYTGLYRGLLPQLVGVAPEKAIKLTMNDLVRDKVRRSDGTHPLWGEIVAGGVAGGCQVVFTNPLEIVKIRLQVAGEVASTRHVSTVGVIKELGFTGLYKGSKACFLRDIPFSAIYFPLYAHLKTAFQNEDGVNSMGSLFSAGVLAGVPAPFLTTPADVIKTRLQVKAREGQTKYNGVIDCAKKLLHEEGFRAFWKGANQRVFRSAPQFGVTLVTYEFLQKILPVDFGGPKQHQPTGKGKDGKGLKATKQQQIMVTNPDHIGGLRTASLAFAGIESKFGLFLPKFHYPNNAHIYQVSKF